MNGKRLDDLRDLCARYFAITGEAEDSGLDGAQIDESYALMVDAADSEETELSAAVKAYDGALFLAAERGQRVISDDPELDELADEILTLAGSSPKFTIQRERGEG